MAVTTAPVAEAGAAETATACTVRSCVLTGAPPRVLLFGLKYGQSCNFFDHTTAADCEGGGNQVGVSTVAAQDASTPGQHMAGHSATLER